MKVASKRGAALAIVIVVSAAILILSAALASAAAYNTGSAQNSVEGRQAYLEAKSAIEFGKAYVKKNPGCGDFTIKADSSSDSGFSIGTGGTSLATYHSADRTIFANVKYRSSDRYRKLKYIFPGFASGAPAYAVVGERHGNMMIFNGSYDLKTVTVHSPVVAKDTVKLNSKIDGGFQADQMYFMGSHSDNCFEITAHDAATTLTSDFIYFNADIKAVNDFAKGLEIEPKNNHVGVIYFNHVKIKIGNDNQIKNSDGMDSELDGYYLFSGTVNLFEDYGSFTKLTDEEVIDELNGEKLNGKDLIATKTYVEKNYTKMVSGDQDGTKWTGEGNIRAINAAQLDQQGKSVFMYIINTDEWRNMDSPKYKADEIHIQYVNNSKNFVFPAGKTVTFMADQISLNTRKADDEVGDDGSKPVIDGTGYAHCILKSSGQSSDDNFYVTFHYKTTVCYTTKERGDITYEIQPGTYCISKSRTIDLFSNEGKNTFTKTPTPPADGTGGSTGSTGGYSYE